MHSAATNYHQNTLDFALLMVFESDDGSWKLGFTTGLGQDPRRRIDPRDLPVVHYEIALETRPKMGS